MRIAIVLLALVLAGCITQGYKPITLYTLHPEMNIAAAQPSEKSLVLRDLLSSPLYNERMAYLNPDGSLGFYIGATWAETPRAVLSRVLRDAAGATQRYRNVLSSLPTSSEAYVVVNGELRRFEEVRGKDGEPAQALCEIELNAVRSGSNEPLFSKKFSASEPIDGEGPAALAAAMNKAISRIAADAAQSLAAQ